MLLTRRRAETRDSLAQLAHALGQFDATVVDTGRNVGALTEIVDQIRARIVAVERLVGALERPAMPRISRRRPLGE